MAKKTEVKEQVIEIQKAIADGNLLIGTDLVMKNLKNNDVLTVFVTSNAPDIVRQDVLHYASLGGAKVVELDETSEDLKEICKKMFNISLVATKK